MIYKPDFERWCRNCHRSIFFHGAGGTKCLFDSTYFEPLANWEEYVQLQAKITHQMIKPNARRYLAMLNYST